MAIEKQNRIPEIDYVIDILWELMLDTFQNNLKWHKLTPKACKEMDEMFTLVTKFEETIETIYNP